MERFLKQGKTGTVFPYTDLLATRKDMQECDRKGNLVEPPPKPKEIVEASGISEQAAELLATEAANGVKAELIAEAKTRFNVDLDVGMPVSDMLDAILVAHEASLEAKPEIDKMTKAQLVAHAKDKFNVDLDPDMKAAEMRAKIAELAGAVE
jgi:hypothetical protein